MLHNFVTSPYTVHALLKTVHIVLSNRLAPAARVIEAYIGRCNAAAVWKFQKCVVVAR